MIIEIPKCTNCCDIQVFGQAQQIIQLKISIPEEEYKQYKRQLYSASIDAIETKYRQQNPTLNNSEIWALMLNSQEALNCAKEYINS
jgi:hypothetical protein